MSVIAACVCFSLLIFFIVFFFQALRSCVSTSMDQWWVSLSRFFCLFVFYKYGLAFSVCSCWQHIIMTSHLLIWKKRPVKHFKTFVFVKINYPTLFTFLMELSLCSLWAHAGHSTDYLCVYWRHFVSVCMNVGFFFSPQSMSFEAHSLTVPSVMWLGLLPSDLQRFGLNIHDFLLPIGNIFCRHLDCLFWFLLLFYSSFFPFQWTVFRSIWCFKYTSTWADLGERAIWDSCNCSL